MTNISSHDTPDPVGGTDDRIDVELYGRYLTGEVTDEERAQVERWAKTPWRRELLRAASDENGAETALTERGLAELRQKMTLPSQTQRARAAAHPAVSLTTRAPDGGLFTPATEKGMRRWPIAHRVGGIAAVGAAALIAVVVARLPQHAAIQRPSRTYATAANEQLRVTLADGTHATLAPKSHLDVLQYDSEARVLRADGEVYFETAPSVRTPFLVQSGAMTTRVLGTSFLVSRHTGESVGRVAVAEGKVLLTSTTDARRRVVVVAGQSGTITDSTDIVRSIKDVAPTAELRGEQLAFHDTPVSSVLAALERWYGYQFRCADPLLSRTVVTIAVSTQSSTEALAALQQILDVNVNVTGDTVTLVPQARRAMKSSPRLHNYDVWTPTKEAGR